jgi:hypothetical protein
MGEIFASDFWMVGKWQNIGAPKGSGIWKGWERVNVWEIIEFEDWLGWLDGNHIGPSREAGRDFLAEAIVESDPIPFDLEFALRWARQAKAREEDWVGRLASLPFPESVDMPDALDLLFDQRGDNCWTFRHRCWLYDHCWNRRTIEEQMLAGNWKWREPNHSQELKPEELGVGIPEEVREAQIQSNTLLDLIRKEISQDD